MISYPNEVTHYNMDSLLSNRDHRKRKRRRRAERLPLAASLVLHDHLRGDLAIVSAQLYKDILGSAPPDDGDKLSNGNSRAVVAVTPHVPSQNLVTDAEWTLVPVRVRTSQEEEDWNLGDSQISASRSFIETRPLWQAFGRHANGSGRRGGQNGVRVQVLDVEPLKLETIYVEVDGHALERHHANQNQFGGGFVIARANSFSGKAVVKAGVKGSKADIMDNEEVVSVVREAFNDTQIVRAQDSLLLPLPTHPITHAAFPPARIIACEPVDQGLISGSTRIIVDRIRRPYAGSSPRSRSLIRDTARDPEAQMEEDTSNEQFYSAAEEDGADLMNEVRLRETDPKIESPESDSETSSDESSDNLISLSNPSIGFQYSGTISSRTTATPRAAYSKANGASTPGSVYSSYTATTARRLSSDTSRLFRARSLSESIPDELLHPRPLAEEDEEARIFVGMKSLLKLGCFSGDWVQIQTSDPSHTLPSDLLNSDGAKNADTQHNVRPVKIYGLPDSDRKSNVRHVSGKRRSSTATASSNISRPMSPAWLSPTLLYNLGVKSLIRISPLSSSSQDHEPVRPPSRKSRVSGSVYPPVAKEVTLVRIFSPLSTDRSLQTGLFAALKAHFKSKRRILVGGDMIALSIDIRTSQLLSNPSNSSEAEPEIEQLLEQASGNRQQQTIAWFKIGQILTEDVDDKNFETWAGAASIDPTKTRMRQVGSEQCRAPSSLELPWKNYYRIQPAVSAVFNQDPIRRYTKSPPRAFALPLRRRMRDLMATSTSSKAVRLDLGPVIICLHSTQREVGKLTLAVQAASDLGLHVFEIDAYDILTESSAGGDVKSEAFIRARIERALTCGSNNVAIIVRHLEVLTADRMVTAFKDLIMQVRVLVVTTTDLEKIPEGMRSLFTHELEVKAPNEGERTGILKEVIRLRGVRIAGSVDLPSVAIKTAALVAGNLVDIVERASLSRQNRLELLISSENSDSEQPQRLIRDLLVSGGELVHCVAKVDFDRAIESARKNFADAIGAPKIPNVSWEDVGGLQNVKDAVMETIQLPMERPELFAKGMRKRSGILFYGPPGTGKTLLAKAIATEFSLNFFSVKGPELLNMYIGESEANVRRVFQRARDAKPCVVFFDELDSVAPKRGNQGDSGGVMDRIVSQLLAELDGMSESEDGSGGVFVIGATNRPDLLDQALLRPGRFDKMLYLGISDTHEKQLTIIEALTRKFSLQPGTSLHRVAEGLPLTYTGADLYALCSDAMLKAITRQTTAIDRKIKALPGGPVSTAYFFDHLAKEEDLAVTVSEKDFRAAQAELVGSVSYVFEVLCYCTPLTN